MLTVEDIQNVKFKKAHFGGYNTENVDVFLDEVISSFEGLLETCKQKDEKINELIQKINEFEKQQESVKDTLASAQKFASKSIKEAEDKASEIIKKADEKAIEIEKEIKKSMSKKLDALDDLKKKVSSFRSELLKAYKNHLKSIDAFPEIHTEKEVEKIKEICKGESVKEIKEEKCHVCSKSKNEDNPEDMFSFSCEIPENKENFNFNLDEQDKPDAYKADISPLDLFDLK